MHAGIILLLASYVSKNQSLLSKHGDDDDQD